MVSDVIASVRKTEDNLSRLKKMRGGSGSAAAADGPSDEDKIRGQLREDIKAFCGQVRWKGVLIAVEESVDCRQN